MYPFMRLAKVMWQAKRNSPVHITDKSEISFSCRPWDLDIFNEMNNGRVLTYMTWVELSWVSAAG